MRTTTKSAGANARKDNKRRDNTRGAEAKMATIARKAARRNKRALCYGVM